MCKRIVLAALAAIVVVCLSGCGGGSKPISVAITASSSTVDGADTVTLTATVSHDKNSGGVSWTITSGGGKLSNTTTTSATYTAPAATSSQQTITITATSVTNSAQTADITITVAALPAVTSTSVSLAGSVGTAYSITLQVSGGIAPYTWALANGVTLPSCLTLKSSGVITTTSGTAPNASCAGTYSNLTFTVTDSGTPNPLTATSAALTITITAPSLTFPASLAGGSVGAAYSASAAAIGALGAATYSLASGALPPDLSLNTSTGMITGTPKASDAGTYTFTVKVVDAFGDTAISGSLSIKIIAPTITFTASLAGGTVGTAYTGSVAATGPVGATTYSLVSGALPADLSLNSSTGAITGTPKASDVGTFTFMVKVVDAYGDTATSGSLSIAITAAPAIAFGAAPTATATVGVAYSSALSASGGAGALTYSISSGSLPAGLNLNGSTGAITGTPTTVGPVTFTAKAQDSFGDSPVTQNYTITVNPGAAAHFAVALTSSSTITAGGTVSFKVTALDAGGNTATGYSGTVMFTSSDAQAAMPANSMLASGTGSFSATLKTAGSQTVTATDTANATVTGTSGVITVNPGPASSLVVTAPSTATNNVAFNFTVTAKDTYNNTATGFTDIVHFTSTDSSAVLPSNSGLNGATGGIGYFSATLKTLGSQTITATDTSNASITGTSGAITVSNTVIINTASINSLDVGQPASQSLSAAGGSGNSANYSWSWAAAAGSSIPPGLSLSTAGAISGTPTTAGTYTVTVTVKDTGITPNQTNSQNFTITINSALSLPAPNPASLPDGTTGVQYTGSIAASGGSGSYCYSVSGLPSDGLSGPLPNSLCGYVAPTFPISGMPTAAGTVTFSLKVSDSTGYAISRTYTITITNPAAPSLPFASSSVPGPAVNGQPYTGSIAATGGVGPSYTWTVNGSTVPTTGSLALGTSGLASQFSVSNSGGSSTLSISGNPTSLGQVVFTAQVKDNTTGLTSFLFTYQILVRTPGQNVTGQISLEANCEGTTTTNLPTFQVSLNTSPVLTTTTDSAGNYTFSNVPNGTWVITPSITGPGSAFYNVPPNITMNGGDITNLNFIASLGYSVSGTVSYSGSTHGQVYLILANSTCPHGSGNGSSDYGTSISAPGAFTIHGVASGTYTLEALMDPSTLGEGQPNLADPAGSTSGLTVSNANVTGASVTLKDPTGITTGSGPTLKGVSPENSGAVITFGDVGVGTGSEEYTSYTVQWSTSTTGFSSSYQGTFKATGANGSNVWIVDAADTSFKGSLANGTAYYFRAMGTNSAGTSPWSYWDGSGTACTLTTCATTVTIGAPSEPDTVSGTVTIPAGVTINSGAVLYAGLYDQTTNTAYADAITSPVSGANAYSVNVPNGSNYILFGIVDQNHDGVIDAGDVTNVNNTNNATISISGTTSGEDLTLPSTNILSAVDTLYLYDIEPTSVNGSHTLTLLLNRANKLPVSVELTSGPNMVTPVDLCEGCVSNGFQYAADVFSNAVQTTNQYIFTVTYSDGTQDTNVTASPTTFGATNGIVNMPATAQSLLPSRTSSTSTTPTFTWVDPTVPGASTYLYSFQLCCAANANIWSIPGPNSNLSGFGSSITSITWGTDPTGDATNVPTVSSLTPGTTYYWSINVQDDKGNVAETTTWYQP